MYSVLSAVMTHRSTLLPDPWERGREGGREGGRKRGTVEGRAKTHVMQSTHQVIEDTSCNGVPHKLFSLTQLPTEKADRKQDEEERRRHGQVTLLTSMSGRYLSSKVAIAASDPEPMET